MHGPGGKNVFPQAQNVSGIGTVLLVEDEEIVLNMTQTMLARLGFKVVTAGDGVEAIKIFRQHHYEIDIVLTDMSMPRMDGWETLSALRRIHPDVPVILSSGHDDSTVNVNDHSELPQFFLHKPYQKAALKDAFVKAMKGLTMNQEKKGSTTPFAGDLQ
jgi:CheY-like chemotaxis protein